MHSSNLFCLVSPVAMMKGFHKRILSSCTAISLNAKLVVLIVACKIWEIRSFHCTVWSVNLVFDFDPNLGIILN